MNLRRLGYFVAVAERLNFTEAAKSLGIAQPPLSVQIRLLESEMGGPLFDRAGRRIALTPLGAILLEEARVLLQQTARTKDRLRDAAEGRSGEIRVAYSQAALSETITRRIRKFLRKNRGVRLAMERQEIPDSPDHFSGCDAAIVESLVELPGAILLEKTTPQIALPPKHRLAERDEVSLSDLIGETLVLPSWNSRSVLETHLTKLVDSKRITINHLEASSDGSDRMWFVSLGLGLAFCSSATRPELDAVLRPLTDGPREIFVQCLTRSGTKAAALPLFLDAIRA